MKCAKVLMVMCINMCTEKVTEVAQWALQGTKKRVLMP